MREGPSRAISRLMRCSREQHRWHVESDLQIGSYGIFDQDRASHSALMPANFTTLAHFSVSSAMNFPKSAGEPANTAAPRSVRRVFMLGSTRAALISLLSFSTISVGVALGTTIPYQPLASKPGRNSPTVGTSGRGS